VSRNNDGYRPRCDRCGGWGHFAGDDCPGHGARPYERAVVDGFAVYAAGAQPASPERIAMYAAWARERLEAILAASTHRT
jgi:hypothetical protein